MFGRMISATIENLGVTNVDVTGDNYVGGLVGCNYSGAGITNCYSTGSVSSPGEYIGGLIGRTEMSPISDCHSSVSVDGYFKCGGLAGQILDCPIVNCHSTGNVTGDRVIGGLVGYQAGSSIDNCHSTGDVSGIDSFLGGLVGMSNLGSTTTNCYSAGNVAGYGYIGGFVGYQIDSSMNNCYSNGNANGEDVLVGGLVGMSNLNSTTTNCYSTGTVTGIEYIGGLVGWNCDSAIDNCYSAGTVSGTANCIGGLVGCNSESSLVNSCFWDIETSGQSTSAGGAGKTTAEMQNVATYTSLATPGLGAPWDFVGNPFDDTSTEDYWSIELGINCGYPYLTDVPVGVEDDEAIPAPPSGIALHPAFPNPFNPTTTIRFNIPANAHVELSVYNVRGRSVATLVDEHLQVGEHTVTWTAGGCASGVYFYRLQSGSVSQVRKMLLLK